MSLDLLCATDSEFQSHVDAGLGLQAIAELYGTNVTVIGNLPFFQEKKRKAGFKAPPSRAFDEPVPLIERRATQCAVIVDHPGPGFYCCGAEITHRWRFCTQHAHTMLQKGELK